MLDAMSAADVPHAGGDGRQGVTLRDYLQLFRRRKWIIIQALILVPAVAVAVSTRHPARYKAEAQVLLTYQSFAGLLTNSQDQSVNQAFASRMAATQAQLARVPTVVDRVARAVPSARVSSAELLHHSSVTAASDADLLTFAVTADTPLNAEHLASGYARVYTAYRHQLDVDALQRARKDVGSQLTDLRNNGQGGSALADKLAETQQQLQTLETLQTSNATVVRTASDAPKVSPKPIRDGAAGLALGLILGLGLALLVDALDTRVRSGEEVAERLGIPILGRVAEPPKRLRERFGLVMFDEPYGRHAEAFRMLRTNLELANIDREARVIAVGSALPAEGKSTTVANLAVAVARGGNRVALVDLDLRQPMLAQFFGQGEGWGVTDVALGRVDLATALLRIDVESFLDEPTGAPGEGRVRLDVLVAGQIPPDPGEFISSRRLAGILADLRERYDVVLVDTPPILSVGDALALSTHLDAFILVSSLALTRRGELHELRRALTFARCEILGTVLTAAGVIGTYDNGGFYYQDVTGARSGESSRSRGA
jgi:succinoglycan biosynthesis transport protein ExoP